MSARQCWHWTSVNVKHEIVSVCVVKGAQAGKGKEFAHCTGHRALLPSMTL